MKQLKHIFYIYNEASLALLMAIAGLVELLCGLLVPAVQFFAFPASALFLVIALGLVISIYRQERKFS